MSLPWGMVQSSVQSTGRVERNIRHIRSAYMAGRHINTPLDELNADAHASSLGPALKRPWPEDDGIHVSDNRRAETGCPICQLPGPCLGGYRQAL